MGKDARRTRRHPETSKHTFWKILCMYKDVMVNSKFHNLSAFDYTLQGIN